MQLLSFLQVKPQTPVGKPNGEGQKPLLTAEK
jgi:hypothetical protein